MVESAGDRGHCVSSAVEHGNLTRRVCCVNRTSAFKCCATISWSGIFCSFMRMRPSSSAAEEARRVADRAMDLNIMMLVFDCVDFREL